MVSSFNERIWREPQPSCAVYQPLANLDPEGCGNNSANARTHPQQFSVGLSVEIGADLGASPEPLGVEVSVEIGAE